MTYAHILLIICKLLQKSETLFRCSIWVKLSENQRSKKIHLGERPWGPRPLWTGLATLNQQYLSFYLHYSAHYPLESTVKHHLWWGRAHFQSFIPMLNRDNPINSHFGCPWGSIWAFWPLMDINMWNPSWLTGNGQFSGVEHSFRALFQSVHEIIP